MLLLYLPNYFIQWNDSKIKLLECWQIPGGSPYKGLYPEAPPERGAFFRLEVYKR